MSANAAPIGSGDRVPEASASTAPPEVCRVCQQFDRPRRFRQPFDRGERRNAGKPWRTLNAPPEAGNRAPVYPASRPACQRFGSSGDRGDLKA